MSAFRATLHLTATEHALLGGISERILQARAALADAERDFAVVGTSLAAARGLRAVQIGAHSEAGLAIECDTSNVHGVEAE